MVFVDTTVDSTIVRTVLNGKERFAAILSFGKEVVGEISCQRIFARTDYLVAESTCLLQHVLVDACDGVLVIALNVSRIEQGLCLISLGCPLGRTTYFCLISRKN